MKEVAREELIGDIEEEKIQIIEMIFFNKNDDHGSIQMEIYVESQDVWDIIVWVFTEKRSY